MGKNKNRNKSTPQNTQPAKHNPTSPVKPILTDEQKIEIKLKHEELQSVNPVEQLAPESETKLKESETKDDLSKYWGFVKDINKRLETLLVSTKDEKEKTSKFKEELESSKKGSRFNKN
jgi:hypothetical protein